MHRFRPGLHVLMFVVALAAIVLCPPAAWAQDGETELRALPDRPDVSESSYTIPVRHVQWEAGLLRARAQGGHRLAMDSLFRLGVRRNWELRLGGVAPAHEHANGNGVTGFSDFVLGIKRHFTDQKGSRPSIGWLMNVKLPTASAGFGNDHVEGNLLLVANKDLGDLFEVEVNAGPGVGWDRSNFGQGVYAVTLSYYTPRKSKNVRVFGEVFGALPAVEGGGSAASAGAGIQYWASPRVALDLGVQVGLSRVAQASGRTVVYVGAGILW